MPGRASPTLSDHHHSVGGGVTPEGLEEEP